MQPTFRGVLVLLIAAPIMALGTWLPGMEWAGWGYVLNQLDAAASFSKQTTDLCFFGHTHTPRAYIKDSSVVGMPFDQLVLEPGKRYFVNAGSVGQPRDGDWRAAYVVFDQEKRLIQLRRLRYDLAKTQGKILKAGLPPRLADRLAFGK